MFAIIGGVIVIGCVIGGYVAMGGHIEVLIQPFELVIIGGGALGAFITSNPMWVVKKCFGSIGTVLKGSKQNKESYLELLGLQYTLFKLLKSKGPMVLEQHSRTPRGQRPVPAISEIPRRSPRRAFPLRLSTPDHPGNLQLA